MMHYRLANDSDMDAIIDFIDMIFSMVRVPHDFEALLPKVYGRERRLAGIHMLAEDDAGRLCGCLGMLTYPLRVAGQTLRVGYLGSMAVHPRARGQGVMGELLRRQIGRAQELGLDLLALGGQRQRYGFSGFETGGASYVYSIRQANVRHALADVEALTLRDAVEADAPRLFALYDAQPVAGARSEADFLTILRSYGHRAITIEQDGKPAPVCESDAITPCCMLRVLRPERVLPAYLRLKSGLSPLESGQLVLGWEGLGACRVTVDGERIDVEACAQAPDIALGGLAMHWLLFAQNRFAAPEMESRLARSWFPLPVHIPEPDSF